MKALSFCQSFSLIAGSVGALSLALIGCSSPDSPSARPSGPAMGIIEVDPSHIPLGEGGSSNAGSGNGGGSSSAAGSAGSGSHPSSGSMKIGLPCDTSSDCPSGQSCHMDPDYIGHRQCTLSCNDDAACKAVEPSSFCIGAHICVHACETNADCGAKTRCGDAGWCERSGPGSGNPYCGGVATPCGLLSGLDCTAADGCHDDSKCDGIAASCYSQFSSYSCSSQDGCFWSSSSHDCTGISRSCSAYSFDFECTSQEGCSWSPHCTGIPQSCDKTLVALCTQQPGCTVHTD